MIRSLRLIVEEKTAREKSLQEEVDYLKKKLFGASSEKRTLDIPGQLNLFDEAEQEQDLSRLDEEEETVVKEHVRKKKSTHADTFKGIKVNKIVIPLSDEEKTCPECGTQMELIGTEYVRREIIFIPAKCEINEYYTENYGCPECNAVPPGKRLGPVRRHDHADDPGQLDHLLFEEVFPAGV